MPFTIVVGCDSVWLSTTLCSVTPRPKSITYKCCRFSEKFYDRCIMNICIGARISNFRWKYPLIAFYTNAFLPSKLAEKLFSKTHWRQWSRIDGQPSMVDNYIDVLYPFCPGSFIDHRSSGRHRRRSRVSDRFKSSKSGGNTQIVVGDTFN